MYSILLFAHSWTRWLVLFAAVLSFLFLIFGLFQGKGRTKQERLAQWAFLGFLDLQFCLGLTLLFLSPLVTFEAVHPWIYRHVGGMVLAITVLHGGNSYAQRGSTPRAIRGTLLGTNFLGVVLILTSIPWPQLEFSRPLFRI